MVDKDERTCSLCHNQDGGWIEIVDNIGYPGHVSMMPCPDPDGVHATAKAARLTEISGLLPEEQSVTLDDIALIGDTARMAELARQFVDRPWGFFTVHGGYGNGKTLTLHAIVNEFRSKGTVSTYVRMKDLIEYVRAGYKRSAQLDEQERYRRLKDISVLAIDECDAARMTDFAYEFRTAFIDDRYRLALAGRAHTVFAMNCHPSDLPGDLWDRIRDGRFIVFHNQDLTIRPQMRRDDNEHASGF